MEIEFWKLLTFHLEIGDYPPIIETESQDQQQEGDQDT